MAFAPITIRLSGEVEKEHTWGNCYYSDEVASNNNLVQIVII